MQSPHRSKEVAQDRPRCERSDRARVRTTDPVAPPAHETRAAKQARTQPCAARSAFRREAPSTRASSKQPGRDPSRSFRRGPAFPHRQTSRPKLQDQRPVRFRKQAEYRESRPEESVGHPGCGPRLQIQGRRKSESGNGGGIDPYIPQLAGSGFSLEYSAAIQHRRQRTQARTTQPVDNLQPWR